MAQTNFIIERRYPRKELKSHTGGAHSIVVNEKIVALEIQSVEKLPEVFFKEFQDLVSKHSNF